MTNIDKLDRPKSGAPEIHENRLCRRAFLSISAVSVLSACLPRGVFVPAPDAIGATRQTIFVATDRSVDDTMTTTGGRSEVVSIGRVEVSIPAAHQTGQIEYPQQDADNSNKFGVFSSTRFASETQLLADLKAADNAADDVVVYVHGYNNTLAEAVYRHAQIAHDFGMTGPQVSFSWTSGAEPMGYIYDRDSIAIARDSLEQLITTLATRQNRRIVMLAHSMGAMLVTEVLRQMAIGGKEDLFERIATVALVSPDIDVDVFRSQLGRINQLPKPFLIFVSQKDRALQFSARLTGNTARLGSTSDIALLQAMGITVIDLSAYDDGDMGNHLAAMSSPTAIAMLRGIRANGLTEQVADNQGAGIAHIIFEAMPT